MQIPTLSVDLIAELRRTYPQRHPKLGMTVEEVWFRAGQSSVVDGLEARLTRESDEPHSILNKGAK